LFANTLVKDATVPGELSPRVYRLPRMDGQYRLARLVSWAFCLALAVIEAWSGQQYFDPDSISYLDMSDGLLRNDWHSLINPHWSPLYPFLIGVVARIAHPSARWELPLVHLLNLLIFVCALAAFEFMMRQVIAILAPDGSDLQSKLPLFQRAYVWELLGYSVFAWTTFFLAGSVRKALPDLCVVSFVYLDAGIVLRILSRQRIVTWFVCLGVALGLGYYAKTVLFPIGLLFMLVAICAAGGLRKAFLPAIAMVLMFFAITLPLVTAVSRSTGHLTIGEAGHLDYAWIVYGQPSEFYLSPPLDYRKDPPNVIHPNIAFYGDRLPVVRILHHSPDVLQFAPQNNATYPPWSNPPLFASGLQATFDFGDQIRTIGVSLKRCAEALLLPIPLTLAAYLVLFFRSAQNPRRWRCILRVWPLFIIGIGGLGLYILVLVEPRYIASFVALLWIGLLCGVQYQRPKDSPRITNIATALIIFSLAAMAVGTAAYHVVRPPRPLQGSICEAYSVASELSKDGVGRGDVIAVIGDGESSMAVARFARVHIDVAIPFREAPKFWQISDPRERSKVYEALREGGARIVVSSEVPPGKVFAEWSRVDDTEFYVHTLE
jgi:hypothetical protein